MRVPTRAWAGRVDADGTAREIFSAADPGGVGREQPCRPRARLLDGRDAARGRSTYVALARALGLVGAGRSARSPGGAWERPCAKTPAADPFRPPSSRPRVSSPCGRLPGKALLSTGPALGTLNRGREATLRTWRCEGAPDPRGRAPRAAAVWRRQDETKDAREGPVRPDSVPPGRNPVDDRFLWGHRYRRPLVQPRPLGARRPAAISPKGSDGPRSLFALLPGWALPRGDVGAPRWLLPHVHAPLPVPARRSVSLWRLSVTPGGSLCRRCPGDYPALA